MKLNGSKRATNRMAVSTDDNSSFETNLIHFFHFCLFFTTEIHVQTEHEKEPTIPSAVLFIINLTVSGILVCRERKKEY